MLEAVKKVVIVGGGSAGWLTAGLLGAEHQSATGNGLEVVLIESPDIKPIGVGEGTWPTMRLTLQKMGISETEFLRECDASFKQGSRFSAWAKGGDEFYYHPFSLPEGEGEIDLSAHWQAVRDQVSFSDAVCSQSRLCESGLAPKQITTPEYGFQLNYGYHLDAGKFAQFLAKHCVEKLGVTHILDNVVKINAADNGDIASLSTQTGGDLAADLFIDCSGFASLLLGQHYGIPFCEKRNILFNDTALAVRVPYQNPELDPIASCTLSTAQRAGWIWDIAVPSRRGVGYVYSSAHTSDDQAEADLRSYITPSLGVKQAESADLRKIKINPGHREKFWHKNCVAVGMSSGFLEPLEASALVLVEASAKMISEQLPANREVMDVVAKRYNDKFLYHWSRIIEFLKLHYVLSQREDSDYWRDNCAAASIPESLQELLSLWRYQSPSPEDTPRIDELFSSASFQYVLYGMGFSTEISPTARRSELENKQKAAALFRKNAQRTQNLMAVLPTNRELIKKVREFGFQKI